MHVTQGMARWAHALAVGVLAGALGALIALVMGAGVTGAEVFGVLLLAGVTASSRLLGHAIWTWKVVGVLALCALAVPARAQQLGTPIAAHPGDTLHLTYVVPTSGLASIRAITSSGRILAQSFVTVTPRPTPPPPVDTTPVTPPPPIAGTPWLLEDFTEYGGSTATFKQDPRHIWSTGEDTDFPSNGVIDTVGGASWRIDFPDRTADAAGRCHDYSVGRNLNLPAQVAEIWLEVVARFQTTWATVAPASWGCTSAAAYKFILPRVYAAGRFNLVVGIFGNEYTFGYPGNEEPADWPNPWTYNDGQWHTYRMHLKAGATGGIATLWIDGVPTKDFENVATTASVIWGIALGRNMNQGPDHPQSMWYRRVAIWQTNPGW